MIVPLKTLSFSIDNSKTDSDSTYPNHGTAGIIPFYSTGYLEPEYSFSLLSNWLYVSIGSEWSTLSRSTIVQYVFHLYRLGSA